MSDGNNGEVAANSTQRSSTASQTASTGMENLAPPKALALEGDLALNWKRWRQKFELYMEASGGVNKEEKIKVAILLHVIGDDALELYNSFEMASEATCEHILQKFAEYCLPKTNESVERHKFNTRVQEEQETIDSFVTDLRKISALCDFGNLRDGLIKDRIVCGITDQAVKQRLLREPNLTLHRAIDICKAAEVSQSQMKTLSGENKIHGIDKRTNSSRGRGRGRGGKQQSGRGGSQGQRTDPKANSYKGADQKPGGSQQESSGNSCGRCGYKHEIRKCPAWNKECMNCHYKGHYAKLCKFKNQSGVHEIAEGDENEETSQEFFLGSIEAEQCVDLISNEEDWYQKVKVKEPDHYINFKLDTGAQVNVISYEKFKQLKLSDEVLKMSNTKLTSYAGTSIPVIGKCYLKCKCADEKPKVIEFQVVKTTHRSPPVLGLKAVQDLNLIQRVNTIDIEKNAIYKENADLFQGIGDIKTEPYDIKLKPDSTPKVQITRKIPFQLQDKLKDELDRMEKSQIIEKVTEPTDWVNPIVVVKKPTGEIRICLDPQELNKSIKREYYPLPTFEEITSKMKGATVFSILDGNKGFWQIRLTDESSKYTTFNTPFGRYCFKRLPFGVNCAPEVFQRTFSEIFEGIEGVQIYMDDLIIWGKDDKEHDARLKLVLEKARLKNVKFNKAKCKLGLPEVKYIGHSFSKDGIKVDDDKVEAIRKMPTPTKPEELSRFLGMLTYVSKFIPNLAQLSNNLRKLCKKDVQWLWAREHQESFEFLKEQLTKAPVLKFYDNSKQTVVSVDASKEGLGAVLLQDNSPVAYVSKTLSETQSNYAPIERETLAIVYGIERFHQYVYGKKVIVESDHKPLEAIFKKPLEKCPFRLQRMRIKLQAYDLEIRYKPGKELYLADALSRASHADKEFELSEKEIEASIGLIENTIAISQNKLDLLKRETESDPELIELLKIIKEGWPNEKNNLPDSLKQYWSFKDEVVEAKGIIFKGQQIIVPKSLRKDMLQRIHFNHLGVEKSKNRARECLFWPSMNKEIEDVIGNCQTCLKFKNANPKETLYVRDIPTRPWQCVATDLFHLKGQDYLLVVDEYSKYPEIAALKETTSSNIIKQLKSIFARHGIPNLVYSDNGPQYSSQQFKKFAETWEFKHQTSSPMFPQSNGLVERHIQTLKRTLKKAASDNKDAYLALLEYRNTPLGNNEPSPAQLLFNRRLNGVLPFTELALQSKAENQFQETLKKRQDAQAYQYNKCARDLEPLQINDKVRVQNNKQREPAIIRNNQVGRPRSYQLQLQSGSVIERNRKHLIKDGENNYDYLQVPEEDKGNVKEEVASEVEQKELVHESNETEKSNENIKKTPHVNRVKRIIKKPAYLRDYVS